MTSGERIDEAAQNWFLLMATGDPTPDERYRFDVWRSADPRHQAVYEELSALWDGIDDLEDVFADSEFKPHLDQADPPRVPVFRRAPVMWAGLAAACVALALFVAPDLAVRVAADRQTGVGEQARIDLPDGSVAWLNTDTAISFDYRDGTRRIDLLRGEAEFDVAKDAARPFSVFARDGRSTALGTVFAVRDDGAGAVVTVSEGTVEVATPPESKDTVILHATDRVRYRAGAAPSIVRGADLTAARAWRDGIIAVKDVPLDKALSEIDRYRSGRIVLLADREAVGKVTARIAIAAIDDGLNALAATHGLTVTRLTDYLVIVR